jgi:hypothetical protein
MKQSEHEYVGLKKESSFGFEGTSIYRNANHSLETTDVGL